MKSKQPVPRSTQQMIDAASDPSDLDNAERAANILDRVARAQDRLKTWRDANTAGIPSEIKRRDIEIAAAEVELQDAELQQQITEF